MTFSTSFQEDLDVVICEEETTRGSTATSTRMSFAFAALEEVLLESAAETSDWFPCETAPRSAGCAVLIEELLGCFCVAQATEIWHVQGVAAVVGGRHRRGVVVRVVHVDSCV